MQPVLLLVSDLFFGVKLADGSRQLGYPVREVATADALLAAAAQGASAIIIDTQVRQDWQRAVQTLKANPQTAAIRVLAFAPHIDVEATRAAVAVGCDRIVTRGKLAAELPDLLRALVAAPERSDS
jgi:CheY-like chemotaxis protein